MKLPALTSSVTRDLQDASAVTLTPHDQSVFPARGNPTTNLTGCDPAKQVPCGPVTAPFCCDVATEYCGMRNGVNDCFTYASLKQGSGDSFCFRGREGEIICMNS
jgi:hypothetical protein